MRIVPAIDSSEDIGSLGIKEGTATIYPWKWYYSMPALGLWIVLALAILLVRENRYPRILLIFIPIFLVRLLWSRFQPILGAPSDVLAVLGMMVDAFVVGMGVLLLLAYMLGNRNRIVTFLLALCVLIVVSLVGIVSNQAWSSRAGLELLVIQALGITTMLLVFVLAGWHCRRRYGPWRFMLWLVLWIVVVSIVAFLIFFLIAVGRSGPVEEITRQIPQVLIAGLIFAICLYMLNLPFMILAFVSPFFRRRFYAYFHLKSMSISSPSGMDSEHQDEQGTGMEKPHSGDLEQKE